MEVSGKICAVTGAASGLGRALARALGARGAHVAISDIHDHGLRETAALIHAESPTCRITIHRVDVGQRASVESYAREVEDQHGGCDILINNAGVNVRGLFEKISHEQLELVLGVNLWGVIHGIKAFMPLLRRRSEGHIVNIASVNAFLPFPESSGYNMSKFAVLALSETLTQELTHDPIHVTCVLPGAIKTNIVRNSSGFSHADAEHFDTIAKTSSERAARAIVRAIEKRQQKLLIGRDAWLLSWAKRLAPAWINRKVATHLTAGAAPPPALARSAESVD